MARNAHCLSVLLSCLLIAAVTAQDRPPVGLPLFGAGYGLDHLIIVVRDLEAAKKTYGALGFVVAPPGEAGVHPVGTKNTTIRLANATYIELLAIHDAVVAARDRPEYLSFLARHEGAFSAGLHVSSAEAAATILRERGIRVSGPEPGTVVRARSFSDVPQPTWWLVKPDRSMLPGDPVFFVDYLDRRNPSDRPLLQARYEAAGRTRHANSAKQIRAVWIAVRDLDRATSAFEALGLPAGARRNISRLGVRAREIKVGSGVLLLLQPTAWTGSVASFLADRGEGIMGISLEVADLTKARQSITAETKQPIDTYTGVYGPSMLVPGEHAHGVWIEYFQP